VLRRWLTRCIRISPCIPASLTKKSICRGLTLVYADNSVFTCASPPVVRRVVTSSRFFHSEYSNRILQACGFAGCVHSRHRLPGPLWPLLGSPGFIPSATQVLVQPHQRSTHHSVSWFQSLRLQVLSHVSLSPSPSSSFCRSILNHPSIMYAYFGPSGSTFRHCDLYKVCCFVLSCDAHHLPALVGISHYVFGAHCGRSTWQLFFDYFLYCLWRPLGLVRNCVLPSAVICTMFRFFPISSSYSVSMTAASSANWDAFSFSSDHPALPSPIFF
jgi:hypothetical protein